MKIEDLNLLPKTRKEALEKGERWYFTGKPCKRGHLCFRYTHSGCSQCRSLVKYSDNKERNKARSKQWAHNNRKYYINYRIINKYKHQEYRRYKKRYWPFGLYDKLYEEQDGKCAICGVFKDLLECDHCHETNKPRGLLCNNCNSGLGNLHDNIIELQRAIYYLLYYQTNMLYNDHIPKRNHKRGYLRNPRIQARAIVDRLLKEQDHFCPITLEDNPSNVDHNHTTNTIRGVLSCRANMGIGRFQDNLKLLENAIKYLQKYQGESYECHPLRN